MYEERRKPRYLEDLEGFEEIHTSMKEKAADILQEELTQSASGDPHLGLLNYITPGKWVRSGVAVRGLSFGKGIILTAPLDYMYQGANDKAHRTRLADLTLASAAPDLMEALEEIMKMEKAPHTSEPFKKAQKALEKAKGHEPNHCEDHVSKSEVMEIVNNAINNLRK